MNNIQFKPVETNKMFARVIHYLLSVNKQYGEGFLQIKCTFGRSAEVEFPSCNTKSLERRRHRLCLCSDHLLILQSIFAEDKNSFQLKE